MASYTHVTKSSRWRAPHTNLLKVLRSNSSLTYTPVSPSRYILELLEKSCLEYWQVELFSSWECHLALVLEGSPRDQLQRCARCLVSHRCRQHIRGCWRRGLLCGRTEGDCQGDGPVPGSVVQYVINWPLNSYPDCYSRYATLSVSTDSENVSSQQITSMSLSLCLASLSARELHRTHTSFIERVVR